MEKMTVRTRAGCQSEEVRCSSHRTSSSTLWSGGVDPVESVTSALLAQQAATRHITPILSGVASAALKL